MSTSVSAEQADRQGRRTVELVYVLTAQDVAGALRAREAGTPAGRRRRWLYPLVGTLGLVAGVVLGVAGDRPGQGPVLLCAAGALLWCLKLFGPRLQARAFGGLLRETGEIRTVVDGAGVLVATADTTTRIGWAAQPTFAETADAFVMLSDTKGRWR